MREIVSKPLDRESFRPYGDFVDLLHIKQMDAMAGADNIFIPDLTTLRLDERMQASVCVARVSQCERISEGILPLDGDIDIFVGPSSFQVNPASIEAFRVPRGTFVRLNPGVLHGRQFVVDSQSVNVMILLPERTFGNDCVFTRLAESDQIKILL